MLKTDKQMLIEAQHEGMDWRDVLRGALEKHRGKRNLVPLVSVEVGISNQTVYDYCRRLEINILRTGSDGENSPDS